MKREHSSVTGTKRSRGRVWSLLVATAAPTALIYAPPLALAQDPAADAQTYEGSLQAELNALRQSVAEQMLRLDEAEQSLARQSDLIDRQAALIERLEARLGATGAAGGAAPATLAQDEYRVQAGDSLYRIASRFGLRPQAIAELNGLDRPNMLRIGQTLRLPRTAQAPQPLLAGGGDAAGAAEAGTTRVAATADDLPQRGREAAERAAAESANASTGAGSDAPQEVGQRPADERGPSIALLSDVGGILTPGGTMFIEPETSFTATSDNRFFFQGTEILDALLIGAIEATDTDRRAVTSRVGLRYGVTSRLELSARVAHVYRNERVAGIAIGDGANEETTREQEGSGLGDVEFGASLQLNDGRRFPYTILNLRGKAPTGRGPFDLERTPGGIELDLATGSGFWTFEPSLTFILPTAPASIFANFGYQMNISTSPNAQLGTRILQDFDPGDAITANIGVGLAVNDRFSLSFGYNQSYFRRTRSTFFDIEDQIVVLERTPSANVGGFAFGGSYLLDNRTRINLNTSIGATDEAPDMTVSLRLQRRLFD